MAVDEAEARLRRLMHEFPEAIRGRTPETHVEHCLTEAADILGLRQADDCPIHGRGCRVAAIQLSGGRFMKKPWRADCHMGAWVLRHLCRNIHMDIHHGERRPSGMEVEYVLITALGQITSDTAYGLPVTDEVMRVPGTGVAADHPRPMVDLLIASQCTPRPGFGGARGLNDLADRIERIVAGNGQLGAEPCR